MLYTKLNMKMRNIILFLILILTIESISAQKSYFFGERYPQKENELPKSRVPFRETVRVPKMNEPIVLNKLSSTVFQLASGWEMAESKQVISSPGSIFEPDYNTTEWYNATVPGTVLTTLVNQGVYPDPYWGVNNLTIPETLCRTDWWYRLAFEIPKEESNNKRTFLRFNGINYKAEIWLNYQLVGKMVGAFSVGEFDITHALNKNKTNVLAVRIFSPNNPGIPQEQNAFNHGGNGGILCLDGPTFISSEGWDWMPGIRDRNIGIWQDVQLLFKQDISIVNPQVLTDLPLPDTKSAEITIHLDVVNHCSDVKDTELNIELEQIKISQKVRLQPNETRSLSISPDEYPQLKIKNPRLWWPNGYGNQELYTLNVSVTQNGNLSDEQSVRFGIRELEYELGVNMEGQNKRILFNPLQAYADKQTVIDNLNKTEVEPGIWIPSIKEGRTNVAGLKELTDEFHPYIILRVNGERIFCKGGNWGMDDAMKRSSRERLEPYVRFHKEQGFTMIRNWTAESTEKVFYDLCDEYGILVFNDFGLSTENHNLLPADYDLFLSSVNEIVGRFRNHPSIALWCPQNEGFPPTYIENGISKIIAEVDGTRHYLGNSRTLNTITSGPWQYRQPTHYYDMARGFASEVGSPSLPTAESLRKMMDEEDLWPIGDVWYYHDWLMGKWGDESLIQSYEDGINYQFGYSSNVDEFSKKAQMVNYESYRAIFEGWNSKLFHSTSGILLWMSHPAWPSMVWQTYSWDYETPGAYYGAKKGCEPIHIQYNMLTHNVEVLNTTLQSFSGLTVVAQLITLDGTKIREMNSKVSLSPNQVISTIPLSYNDPQNDCYFIRLQLKDRNRIISQNFYWMSSKTPRDFTPLNNIPEVVLLGSSVSRRDNGFIKGTVKLINRTDKVALALKLNVRHATTGEAVLPVYFEDGYFSLIPGEERSVSYEFLLPDQHQGLKLTVEGYNVNPQDISLIH